MSKRAAEDGDGDAAREKWLERKRQREQKAREEQELGWGEEEDEEADEAEASGIGSEELQKWAAEEQQEDVQRSKDTEELLKSERARQDLAAAESKAKVLADEALAKEGAARVATEKAKAVAESRVPGAELYCAISEEAFEERRVIAVTNCPYNSPPTAIQELLAMYGRVEIVDAPAPPLLPNGKFIDNARAAPRTAFVAYESVLSADDALREAKTAPCTLHLSSAILTVSPALSSDEVAAERAGLGAFARKHGVESTFGRRGTYRGAGGTVFAPEERFNGGKGGKGGFKGGFKGGKGR